LKSSILAIKQRFLMLAESEQVNLIIRRYILAHIVLILYLVVIGANNHLFSLSALGVTECVDISRTF
jgi:hypothetical protein